MAPCPHAGPLGGCSPSPCSAGGTGGGAQHCLGACPPQQHAPSPLWDPPKTSDPAFQSLGSSLNLLKDPEVSTAFGRLRGSGVPPRGAFGGYGGANVAQHPPRATHTSPRGSQPTLGFCFAATAKQVLLGYKKALEAGQAGSRAAGIHARALADCHRLTCQGKQCYLPRNRGTENTTTAARTPNTGSRGTAWQPAAPHEEPGSVPHGRARHRHGFSQNTQFPRPQPRAGEAALASPRRAGVSQMPFCFSEQPRVLRLFINFKTKGREASWNRRGRWGCFLGKQKQRGGATRAGRCWRLEELDPSLGAASGRAPGPGTPASPPCHASPRGYGCLPSLTPSCEVGAGSSPGGGRELPSWKKENQPQLATGSATGRSGRGVLEAGTGCQRFANGLHLRQGFPAGTATPAKRTPAPAAGGTPTPNAFPCWVPSLGGSGPGPQRGLCPGWEGKNQKQIAGVNGAEPRAASAAAV